MPQTTVTSREFNQDIAAAKRAAKQGPVVVTDRGEPSYVLMTHQEYRRLSGQDKCTIVELLRDPESVDIDFEPAKLGGGLLRPANLI